MEGNWKELCREYFRPVVDRDVGRQNEHCRRCRHGFVRYCRCHCCCSLASFYLLYKMPHQRFFTWTYPPMQSKQYIRWMTGDPQYLHLSPKFLERHFQKASPIVLPNALRNVVKNQSITVLHVRALWPKLDPFLAKGGHTSNSVTDSSSC